MKLISKFKNRYNNITYRVYELSSGIKVLHLENPATIDFDFAIKVRGGSAFEMEEGVPKGTAHFLEHMLLNPNSTFETKEDLDRFEQGNKSRPSIHINAFTTSKYIELTGHSNEKSTMRVLKRMSSVLDFPKEKFSNFMEKERGIIIAEKSRKNKKEKDAFLNSLEFLFKENVPEISYDILGEPEDIKKIEIDHLERFFRSRFSSNNAVFAVQSKDKLNKEIVEKIEDISNKIVKGDDKRFRKIELKNKWKVGCFEDERALGVGVSFIYFDKEDKKINYKKYAQEYIYGRLLDWLAFDILREEMSLIYDFSVFRNNGLGYYYNTNGFRFVTEREKASKMLLELHTLLYTTAFIFLKSKKGKEWFNDVISTYIFPRTVKFNEELAEMYASSLLEDSEIFNSNIAVREAKKVTIEDVQKHLEKKLNTPPHIWIESDMSEQDMKLLIMNSPFFNQFKV
jgi:predicted Zn-dependent peptidase